MCACRFAVRRSGFVLQRGKSENFVFADGATEGSTKLLAVKTRHWLCSIECCGQALQVPVAFKKERRSMHLITARTRDDVDDAISRIGPPQP